MEVVAFHTNVIHKRLSSGQLWDRYKGDYKDDRYLCLLLERLDESGCFDFLVFFLDFFLLFFFSSSSEDDEKLESEEGHGDVDVEVEDEDGSGAVFLPGGSKVGVGGEAEMFISKQSKKLRIYFFQCRVTFFEQLVLHEC